MSNTAITAIIVIILAIGLGGLGYVLVTDRRRDDSSVSNTPTVPQQPLADPSQQPTAPTTPTVPPVVVAPTSSYAQSLASQIHTDLTGINVGTSYLSRHLNTLESLDDQTLIEVCLAYVQQFGSTIESLINAQETWAWLQPWSSIGSKKQAVIDRITSLNYLSA